MDEQHFEYRNGRTNPDKSSRGLIAALLICIIFLCGVISGLGFMNIRLFRLLENSYPEGVPLSFSQGDPTVPSAARNVEGMALQELSPVYQQLHDLPMGLYVSQVCAGSNAASLGIVPGDVLVAYNGTPVPTLSALTGLQNAEPTAQIRISRAGQILEFTLTLTQQE